MRRPALGLFLLAAATGCAGTVTAPPPTDTLERAPTESWALVLDSYVDDEGRVDFRRLADGPHLQHLEHYVRYVGTTKPDPHDANEALAHHLNAYNALAMYGVIRKNIPKALDSTLARARFFFLTDYRIAGEDMSLYKYENDVIRPLGEPRVHVALNCMSVGCPRLPRVPFSGERLDEALDAAAIEFFNSEKYVQVDQAGRTARLSEILKFYTDDFVREGVADSLIAYVNRYRREKIPEDYDVDFIDYDWTINRQ